MGISGLSLKFSAGGGQLNNYKWRYYRTENQTLLFLKAIYKCMSLNKSKPVESRQSGRHLTSFCEKRCPGPTIELQSWMMLVHNALRHGLICCESTSHDLSSSSLTHGILSQNKINDKKWSWRIVLTWRLALL